MLYACAEQPHHHRGHEVNQVTSPVAATGGRKLQRSGSAVLMSSFRACNAANRDPSRNSSKPLNSAERLYDAHAVGRMG